MFRRRRSSDDDEFDDDATDGAAGHDGEVSASTTPESGPYDEQAPDDGLARLDLGALLVPILEGVEIRVDMSDPAARVVQSVTLVAPRGALQLSVFAAPRTSGIWDEVREEIREGLLASGGRAADVEGPHGPELSAAIPGATAGELVPGIFVGVDGPRWFLRGVFTGAAAAPDTPESALLRAAFAAVVVVRGGEAMTVREQLPMRLPVELADQLGAPAPAAPAADLGPFVRGPEITETR